MTPRVWGFVALVTLIVWGGLEAGVRRSSRITDDWHGWRQADTQAIARNFVNEEFAPLKPRIDWRGDGPGYVEAEMQLYTALVAAVMLVTGESLWPGQVLSLASLGAAALLLFRALRRRFGDGPAYAALVTMLATKGVVVIATSIQPDTLAFAAYVLGVVAFRDYLDQPSTGRLILWTGATTLAGLVKPTMLEIGIAQALMCGLLRRDLLRSPRLWLGWTVVLVVVGAHLLYARQLFLDYGNTFGVLSGGDSKLPGVAALLSPRLWLSVASFEVVWGIGVPGALVAIHRVVTRSLAAEELALAVAALCASVLAFRYTSGSFGTHYHLPHAVLGAWLVARAVAELAAYTGARPLRRHAVVVGVALVAAASYSRAVLAMRRLPPEPETEVGRQLAAAASPGTLVAVRARAPGFDPEWDTVNNFEDPRVFYLSRTRGWVLPNDEPGAARLADAAARGARYYAHVNQMAADADLQAWLDRHGELVSKSDAGAVYRLRQSLTK